MKTQPGSVSEPAAESVALSPRRETDRVRIITETIVMVALAGALYLIKIFAGFFQKIPILGVGVGIAARFCSHLVSGVLFFASYAPAGVSPFVYSAVYNGGFLIPEFVITVALMIALVRVRALERYL